MLARGHAGASRWGPRRRDLSQRTGVARICLSFDVSHPAYCQPKLEARLGSLCLERRRAAPPCAGLDAGQNGYSICRCGDARTVCDRTDAQSCAHDRCFILNKTFVEPLENWVKMVSGVSGGLGSGEQRNGLAVVCRFGPGCDTVFSCV